MENKSIHFRHNLLFYFKKGLNATQAHKEICDVYGNEALKKRQCQNWYAKFRRGNFSLNDEPRSGRPLDLYDDQIREIMELDRHITTRQLAEKLNVSHACIEKRIKQMEYVKKP